MAPKRHLFLHCGYPRTGTTSFQSILDLNRNGLASNGYCVPPTVGNRHRHLQAGVQLSLTANVQKLIQLPEGCEPEAHLDNWLTGIVADAPDFERFIMSEETLAKGDFGKIAGFEAQLRKHFDEITILICFRPHGSYLRSDFSNRVRAGYFSKAFRAYATAQTEQPFMSYCDVLSRFMEVFGADNVKAVAYNPKGDDSSHSQLFAAMGLDLTRLRQPPSALNRSLSPQTIDLKRRMNRRLEISLKEMGLQAPGVFHDALMANIEDAMRHTRQIGTDVDEQPFDVPSRLNVQWDADWDRLTGPEFSTQFKI
ncbi:hypothetical protein [Shimia sp. Alg240-R146]|uniref:hypothetical protein n=1 Tax=Shimia sp. Alg240-R146 TaxID=2993449 RepID=UPI0022E392D8|nr:hypothetical protein [Shimia sp. Alg240-R146]